MTTQVFRSDNGDCTAHTMIVGQSRQGMSLLLQVEARRLGITCEELVQRLEPTEEQKEQLRMRQEEADQADKKRLDAVREAYWQNTPEGHPDLDQLHDLLVAASVAGEPTREQIRRVFMLLPAEIIGAALSWGLGDTDERESIYEFLERNKQQVLEVIKTEST